MKQREIEKNLRTFCTWAKENLCFLGGGRIIAEKADQTVAEILRKASLIYPYDYLDKVYNEGFESLWSEEYELSADRAVLFENLLAAGTAFLTEYGLDEKDYIEWVAQQSGNPFSLLLFGVLGKTLTEDDVGKIKAYDDADRRNVLLADSKAGQFMENTGICICAPKCTEDGRQFRVFDQYILYSKSFDEYKAAVNDLYDAVWTGAEEMDDCIEETLHTSGAYGSDFPKTLAKIAEQLNESLQSVLTELTRCFRSRAVNPEVIRDFRDLYANAANDIKAILLEILTPITQAYEELAPESKEYSHDYINDMIGRDHLRRVLMMENDYSVKSNALHVGNDILTDALTTASNSVADAVINAANMSIFENKMKAVLEKMDLASLCSEDLFEELRHKIENEYYSILGVCNYSTDEADIAEDITTSV